jgi:hypothetical protein
LFRKLDAIETDAGVFDLPEPKKLTQPGAFVVIRQQMNSGARNCLPG